MESIRKVEKTRPVRVEQARRGKRFTPLSLEERPNHLQKYHPDYRENSKREVRVGPNQGDFLPMEVADLLESRGRIDPDRFDLSGADLETDVLIIGGGGAGSAAALAAEADGAEVLMATKLRHGDANTVMAEGGIQVADQEADSPACHFLDVMGGGHFTNNQELVAALVGDAPEVLQWLEGLGALFDKYPDGRMRARHGGGTSRKRLHSAGDLTGAEIMRVLRDEVRSHTESIRVMEFCPAVELLLDEEGQCAGAILYNLETKEYYVVRAKAVILGTGGFGRLHLQGFPCTNHYGATADGLVMAYRAGVKTCFLESTQFHPTGAVYPEQIAGLLITEKVRGLGAHLLNKEGEAFCFPLEPRDIAAACVIRECGEREMGVKTPTGRFGVWLDSPMIEFLHGKGAVQRELPAKYIQFQRFGIDISEVPFLIYPTLHYQNGGLEISPHGKTAVTGLFAAGEVSGGIHGKNRLMGNSLLDVLVFGLRAGKCAAEFKKGTHPSKKLTLDHLRTFHETLKAGGVQDAIVGPKLLPDYVPDVVRERRREVTV